MENIGSQNWGGGGGGGGAVALSLSARYWKSQNIAESEETVNIRPMF